MVLVVASLDFGTTYSGWAYSFTHEFQQDPTQIKSKHWNADQFMSNKAPTCVLIRSDGKTVDAFGYEAEDKYAKLSQKNEHKDWYYFKHFKMKLFESEGLKTNDMLEDATGKPLSALTVFSLTIKYLHDDLYKTLENGTGGSIFKADINWVLTVPAIWSDMAKQFMRRAAREAGIETGHLTIALEPEVASIFCRHSKMMRTATSSSVDISMFPSGTRYLVCDAGGGTVDITVHEITSDMRLKEIEKASGGAWGGTQVNLEFERLIDTIAGCSVVNALKEEFMDDYLDLMATFELKKREFKDSSEVLLRYPSSLKKLVKKLTDSSLEEQIEKSIYKGKISRNRDKLSIEYNVMASLFESTINNIIEHLSTLICNHADRQIGHIVMVGGFSESPLLQRRIKEAFRGQHIIIPAEASLAVLKGAVIFGHNKQSIVSRIARFTYGISSGIPFNEYIHPVNRLYIEKDNTKLCVGVFSKLVTVGQSIPVEDAAGSNNYGPLDDRTYATPIIYATKEKKPMFTDDPGCFRVGEMYVNFEDRNGKVGSATISMYFGGTEITVKAVLLSTGEETSVTFDLPD
ncbi:heat shock 70 kDa protein 12A-like isoform X2 [Dreissena polymorpha]|nr:heat shock 70 kDa protein 12A-like isoform X2 [Dreissena polymorpha]